MFTVALAVYFAFVSLTQRAQVASPFRLSIAPTDLARMPMEQTILAVGEDCILFLR
jgi:hypothetical protein